MKVLNLKDEIEKILEELTNVISKVPIIEKSLIIQQKGILLNILKTNVDNSEYTLSEEEVNMILNFKTLISASQDLSVIELEKKRDNYIENIKNWGTKDSENYMNMSIDVFNAFSRAYKNLTLNDVA